MAAQLRLVREGKQLDPMAACGLAKNVTVHVLGVLNGGARIRASPAPTPTASELSLAATPSPSTAVGLVLAGSAQHSWRMWRRTESCESERWRHWIRR